MHSVPVLIEWINIVYEQTAVGLLSRLPCCIYRLTILVNAQTAVRLLSILLPNCIHRVILLFNIQTVV